MRICQYKHCAKVLINRRMNTKYCKRICGERHRTFNVRHKLYLLYKLTEVDVERWIKIYKSSSLESLRELVGLKNEMPKQATSYLQLIKLITVMSKL